MKLTQEINSSNADLRKQLKTLQTELELAIERREAAIATETTAKTDAREHQKLASEAQDKYERELILHAADVSALTEVKQELEGFHEKLRKAEEAAKEARDTLQYQKQCWEEQEKLVKDDRVKLQKRNDDILEQNSCLHDQLEQLSDQMRALQQRKEEESRESHDLAEKMVKEPTEKTPEQLLEVIKFIRKEKSITEARLDVVQAESSRYKQRLEFVEKQLEESNKVLQEERERAQVSIQTAAQHADLLRKVENMNLLQDSNRHLREEKDRLTQQMKGLEARAKKLEDDIEPLQANLRDVTVERDTLQAENAAQRGEIDSWKARTNHLIEQCERCDPEEFKQALKDRDDLKQNVNSLKDDISKLNVEKVNLNMQISQLKNEETLAKKKIDELTAAKTKMTEESEAKDKDLESKNQTISQLKLIGRRYRKETQEVKEELEKLKQTQQQQGNLQECQEKLKVSEEKLKSSEEKVKGLEENLKISDNKSKASEEKANKLEASLKAAEVKSTTTEQQRKTLEDKVKTLETSAKTAESAKKSLEEKLKLAEEKVGVMESNIKTAEEKAKSLEQEKSTASAGVQGLEKEKADLQKKQGEMDARMKALDTQVNRLNEELSSLKQAKTSTEQEKVEAEKQRDQTKKLLGSAKQRLIQQKNEIEKLKKEQGGSTQSTEEKELRLSVLQSECEQLRQELTSAQTSAKQELEALQKQNSDLQSKCSHLQKLLEVFQQRQIQSPPGSQPPPSSEPPKTANIRPMTAPTSSPQVRMAQATPIQPVRSTATVETRAMASIRPMAVSPATSTPAPSASASQTPMATVHPTTQEGDGMMSPGHVTSQGRPTQTVQPVSPHVEEHASTDIPTTQETAAVVSTQVTTVTSSLFSTTSVQSSTSVQTSREPVASGSTGVFVGGMGGGIFGGKRAREEEQDSATRSESQPEGPTKKTKTMGENETLTEGHQSEASTSASTRGRTEANVALVEPEPAAAVKEQAETEPQTRPADPTVQQTEESEELPEFVETEEDEPKEEVDSSKQGASSGVRRPSQPLEFRGDGTEVNKDKEGGDGVILVLDENEAEAGFVEQGEAFAEEEEFEGEEEEMEEHFADTQELAPEEIVEDDDDVVIIEEEESADDAVTPQVVVMESQGSGSSGTGSSVLSSQPSDPGRLGPPVGVARLHSSGSRSHLQPFSFGGDAGAELGDDGIVPSTPTLFVPRRNDGFAEAISSPLVSRQFVFGGQSEASSGPEFGQLASQGLDAPIMDFSHFERSDAHSPQPPTGSTGGPSPQSGSVKPMASTSQTIDSHTAEVPTADVPKPQDASEMGSEQQKPTEEGLVIRYPPTKPTLIEEPPTSAGVPLEKPGQAITVITSTSPPDKQDDPQTKTKIEPIVWDRPSTSGAASSGSNVMTSPHASQQMHMSAMPGQGNMGNNQPQPIASLGTPQRSFSGPAQRSFRSRGAQGRGQNTAFRARPQQQRGAGQMRRMSGQNIRGGSMSRRSRAGYRGGSQQYQ